MIASKYQQVPFTHLFFGGKGLRPLNNKQIEGFENKMTEYALQIKGVPSTLAVTCKLTTQARVQRRNRNRPRRNLSIITEDEAYAYQNEKIVSRDLKSCGTSKKRSITLYYECTWQTTSNDDVTQYYQAFINWIDSFAGKDSIIAGMQDLGICTLSARDAKVDLVTRAPTLPPTPVPTLAPTLAPTNSPTRAPTNVPTNPTVPPTRAPTDSPTRAPTNVPTNPPTLAPTNAANIPSPADTTPVPTSPPTLAPTPPSTPAPTSLSSSSSSWSYTGTYTLTEYPTNGK